jgi:TolA-binding protein
MTDEASPLPPQGVGAHPLLESRRGGASEGLLASLSARAWAGLPNSFWSALALSALLGAALGLRLGGGLPGAPAPEDSTARLAETLPGAEVARLVDELRGLRAQIEQMRHNAELQRVAERVKALETARDALADANGQTAAQLAARLASVEARLAEIEVAGADSATPGTAKRNGMRR